MYWNADPPCSLIFGNLLLSPKKVGTGTGIFSVAVDLNGSDLDAATTVFLNVDRSTRVNRGSDSLGYPLTLLVGLVGPLHT